MPAQYTLHNGALTASFSGRPCQWMGDDSPNVWLPHQIPNRTLIPLLTSPKMFGQGGQVPSYRHVFNYDVGESFWWAQPIPLNLNTAKTITLPFEKWGTWSPPDEPGSWQYRFVENINTLPPPPMFVQLWGKSHSDDPPVWQYKTPFNLSIDGLFTGFNAIYPWSTLDDASTWQYRAPFNLPLDGRFTSFLPSFVSERSTRDDFSTWQYEAPHNLPLIQPAINVSYRTLSLQDDASFWQYRAPFNLPLDGRFTSFLPTYQAAWSFNDSSNWQWEAPYDLPLFRGFVPAPTLSYSIARDDLSSWQYIYPANPSLNGPTGATFTITDQYRPGLDDASAWQYRFQFNISAAASIAYPVETWGTWSSPDEQSFWYARPIPPNPLNFNVANTITYPVETWGTWSSPDEQGNWQYKFALNFGSNPPTPPSTTPQPLNSYNIGADVTAPWQYKFEYNLTMIASLEFVIPPASRDAFDDASFWQWQQLGVSLAVLPAPVTPKILPQYRPGLDDPGTWQYRSPYNLIMALNLSFPVEMWGTWSSPDEQSGWRYQPPYNFGLYPPAPQITPRTPNWRPQYDDPSTWQYQSPANFGQYPPVRIVPVATATRWEFSPEEPSSWVWLQPYNLQLVNVAPPVQKIFEWLIRARRRGRR